MPGPETRQPVGPPRRVATSGRTELIKYPMMGVALAVFTGILWDRWVPMGRCTYLTAAWVAWGLWRWTERRQHPPACPAWWLFLCLAALAAARHHTEWSVYRVNHIVRYATETPRPVALRATLASSALWIPVDQRDALSTLPPSDLTRADLNVQWISHRGRWRPVRGRLRLICQGRSEPWQAGEKVQLVGRLARLARAANPGQWDPLESGRVVRQVCRVMVPHPGCVQRLDQAAPPRFSQAIDRLRGRWERALVRRVARHGDLAAALLLGSRHRLASGSLDPLLKTGSLHLLAISGLHVGMLAGGVWLVSRLGLIRRSLAAWVILVGSLFYASITGSHAPVLRATVLLQLVCLAWLTGRPISGVNGLAAAAATVVLLRPADLFRTGPQLSFVAVAALIAVRSLFIGQETLDPLERLLRRSRPWYHILLSAVGRRVGQLLLASTSVWLVTLPLVACRFHLVAWTGPLVSALLFPPAAVALFAAAGILMTDAWFPLAAATFAHVCDTSLTIMMGTAGWFAQLPGSYQWMLGPGNLAMAIGYLLALFAICVRPRSTLLLILSAAVPWIASVYRSQPHPQPTLDCWFLSVGHGNCVVVRLPSGKTIMLDAGHLGAAYWEASQVSFFLWHQGIASVDAIVVSHPDADHYNMVPELARRMHCRRIFIADRFFDDVADSQSLQAFARFLAKDGPQVITVRGGDELHLGPGVTATVLHPGSPTGAEPLPDDASDNARSLVVAMLHRGHVVLFPGDIEPPGLDQLLALPIPSCIVAMTPHHGNLAGRAAEFSAWCRPSCLVTSSSLRDWQRYRRQPGLPDIPHWCTARQGTIHITIDASGWRIRGFRTTKR